MEMVSRDGPLQGRCAVPHVNDLKKQDFLLLLCFCLFSALTVIARCRYPYQMKDMPRFVLELNVKVNFDMSKEMRKRIRGWG